ncbi:low choriolytic enzyme-like [Megalops cyprinoides]|uniref:low choriolytic enzyme-like n=1 Tax=Megalops cyprinoides TaxID=118141 RepID=UPI0018656AA3|nr:low choriolytic enzyme-like [Megalops cyprinoides]
MSPAFVITLTFTLLCVAHCYPSLRMFSRTVAEKEDSQDSDHIHHLKLNNSFEKEDLSVSAIIEKANRNIGQKLDKPLIVFGDISVTGGLHNADPCTSSKCKWIKSPNGKVYVPYKISKKYSTSEVSIIRQSLESFTFSTCIRFIPWNNKDKDYLYIMSHDGCFSSIERQGGLQLLSLNQKGCLHRHVIQHELLHALGFHHEHVRSDRDKHIEILFENIEPDEQHNFNKVNTNNLGTPYDYNSVMQYERYAFSKNGKPTMIPKPNENVEIGKAKKMSPNDILRVNKLYECSKKEGAVFAW